MCVNVLLLSARDPLLCIILVMEASADRDLRVGRGSGGVGGDTRVGGGPAPTLLLRLRPFDQAKVMFARLAAVTKCACLTGEQIVAPPPHPFYLKQTEEKRSMGRFGE